MTKAKIAFVILTELFFSWHFIQLPTAVAAAAIVVTFALGTAAIVLIELEAKEQRA